MKMDATLKYWIDAIAPGLKIANVSSLSNTAIRRAILNQFESVGYARRRLELDGTIYWQATKAMREYLKDCEIDARDNLLD
jgi:hypothetical protein